MLRDVKVRKYEIMEKTAEESDGTLAARPFNTCYYVLARA